MCNYCTNYTVLYFPLFVVVLSNWISHRRPEETGIQIWTLMILPTKTIQNPVWGTTPWPCGGPHHGAKRPTWTLDQLWLLFLKFSQRNLRCGNQIFHPSWGWSPRCWRPFLERGKQGFFGRVGYGNDEMMGTNLLELTRVCRDMFDDPGTEML